MAKIKICGIRRIEDAEYLNEFLPDYVGFILSPGFKRSISRETAAELRSFLSPKINVVGVFVNDSIENIDFFLKNNIIDTVQLHGDESPKFCERINADRIKYFSPKDFHKIAEYDTEYYLFDSGTGTGNTFNWSKIPNTAKPFFLAGGINKNNLVDAIEKVNPYCIDLSSAVETDGKKDYNKIKEIMEIIR